jgi:hypothetical protein
MPIPQRWYAVNFDWLEAVSTRLAQLSSGYVAIVTFPWS